MALSRITEAVASFTDLTIGDDLTLTDDLLMASDANIIKFGADADVTLTHVHNTGLLLNSTSVIQFNDASQNIGAPNATTLDINATDEIELNATLVDVNANLDVSGTIVSGGTLTATTSIGIGSAVLTEAELEFLDGITAGTAAASKALILDGSTNITGIGTIGSGAITSSSTIQGTTITATTAFVPDASDGAALGTSSLEFSDLFLADAAVINLGADQDVTLTHVADTGILLNSSRKIQFGDSATFIQQSSDGVMRIDGEATINLNASSNVDVSNDIRLRSDASVISFGADSDVTLTHVADTGILLNSTMAIQFNDASQFINAPSATVLDINATDEIELNATLVDVNANLDVSGTYTGGGLLTTGGNIVIPDAGNIGSASDTDAIAIASNGAVTLTQALSGTSADFDGGVTIDNITIDGTEIDLSSGDLTLDVAGEIVLDADGGNVIFSDAGTTFGRITNTSSDLAIKSDISDKDIIFKGNDGGSVITALTLDMSAAGDATFNQDIYVRNIYGASDGNTGIQWEGSDVLTFHTGGAENIKLTSGAVIFNEDSADMDFRVEGNGNTHALFVQGGSDFVGIGNSSPNDFGSLAADLVIGTTSGEHGLTIATGTSNSGRIQFADNTSSPFRGAVEYSHSSDDMIFYTAGSERMRIKDDGNVLINKNNTNSSVGGILLQDGQSHFTRGGGQVVLFNRQGGDGAIVGFASADSTEGTVSISGTTTSYNAFSASHWSRLTDNSKPTILKGTVIETIDEMCDWYQVTFTVPETDDTPEHSPKISVSLKDGQKVGDKITYNHDGVDYEATIIKEADNKHTKCKISDTADSKRVYGVFADWDNDDDTVNDMYVTAVGTHVVRVHSSATVSAGDLLTSNGDGTAKVQDDDIIRSKTIGKVLTNIKQETYSDGSYTVPCALYCG